MLKANQTPLRILGAVAALLLIPGCLDVEVSSTVYRDGSLDRTLEISGDPGDFANAHYPLPRAGDWEIEVDSIDFVEYKAYKHYENSSAFNDEFRLVDPHQIGIEIDVAIRRHFRWFYSTIEYVEHYRAQNLLDEVPWSDYVTAAEMELFVASNQDWDWPAGADSADVDRIEEALDIWFVRNNFEGVYRLIYETVQAHNVGPITAGLLAERKDSLVASLDDDDVIEVLEMEYWIDLFGAEFGEEPIRQVMALNQEAFNYLQEQYYRAFALISHTYNNHVSMPGIIIDTNAHAIEGNTATWENFALVLLFREMEMLAKSRVLNLWAIYLSGAVVLVLVAGLVITALRSPRSVAR